MAATDATPRQRADGRSAGGKTVVFVHGSLSSGGMWKGVRRALEGSFRVLTPDLTGYGAKRAWPHARPFRLSDEVRVLAEAVAHLDGPFDLVGHSYGGLVALRYAWANRDRIRSLMLFEPTLFRILKDPGIGSPDAWGEIDRIARVVRHGVAVGAPEAAMRHFVDYWNGKGAWKGLPEDRREAFARQATTVSRNFDAAEGDAMPLGDLRTLEIPAFVVAGAGSTKASLATSWTVASRLPVVEHVTVGGAGHMMPVTHAQDSLRLIEGWLDKGRPPFRAAA